MAEILRAGMEQGVFRLADPEWTRIAILSLCIDVSRWYRHGTTRTPMALGFQYADLAAKLAGAT